MDYCSISKSVRIGAMARQRSLLIKILIMSIELLIIFMLASNHILIPKACSFNYFPDSPLPSKKSFREELSLQSAPSIHWDEATQFSAFKPFSPDNSQPQRKNTLPKVSLNFRVPKNEEFRLIPLTYFSFRREGYQQETRHLCDPLFEYFDPNEAPLYKNSKENLSDTQAEDCSLEDSDRIGIKQKIGAKLTPHCQIQQKKYVNNDPFIIIKQRRPNLSKKSKPIQKELKRANLNFPCSLNSLNSKKRLLTKQLSTHSGDQSRDEPEFIPRRSKSQLKISILTAMEEGMAMNFLIDSEENYV